MRKNVWYLSFGPGSPHLGDCIYISMYLKISFFFTAEYSSILCIPLFFFLKSHSSVDKIYRLINFLAICDKNSNEH